MSSTYYFAAWTDSGCLLGCWHQHQTVSEAASCISYAGGYVIAVEDGVMRCTTAEEEAEFQYSVCARRNDTPIVEFVPAAGEGGTNRYAIMTRIKVVDGWTWASWNCYETYEQAVKYARQSDKVVLLGSAEWKALRQHTEPVPIVEEHKDSNLPSYATKTLTRRTGDTLVEFVSCFLEPYGISQPTLSADECSHPAPRPLNETKPDAGSRSFCGRVSGFVEFVLNWLNEWETKELERMHALQVPEWLEALGKRVRRALRRERVSKR